jgi:hypothetical protein
MWSLEGSDVGQFCKWFSAVDFCTRHVVVCGMLSGIMFQLTQVVISCIKNIRVGHVSAYYFKPPSGLVCKYILRCWIFTCHIIGRIEFSVL